VKYLLAILLPPVAVLSVGKPAQAVLNLVLTLCFFVPGMLHALLVVHSAEADARTQRLIDAQRQSAR
jgi:uncharacterized membrane protein YqaE (UPF0057 family)